MKLNCIVIDDESHAISELSKLINLNINLTLLNTFMDAREAIAYLQNTDDVHIVFSDINMPALNGLNAGTMLNKFCDFLIYVTAHNEFALDAFGVNAAGYLTKPVIYAEFMERMEIIFDKYESIKTKKHPNSSILFVKGGLKNNFIKIIYNEIIFIEASLNYTIIHATTGIHMTYITLKDMEEKLLDHYQFIRISKSFIISIVHLIKVEGSIITTSDKREHKLGNRYKDEFFEYLKKHTLSP
jgi:two-component system LytT family response regulator